jgi:hypothetical protein
MAREIIGKRAWRIVAIAVSVAMAAICSAQGATSLFATLVDAIIRHGPDSQLPANLSVELGVGRETQKTAVKQAVVRDGDTVRTFNVCSVNRANLVIMNYDERSHSMKAYLVSVKGALRKAVYYQAGAAAAERSAADARSDFAAEIKFWTDFSEKSLRAGSN